jgi:glycosyltransferase involved in cell wall biosynthesis
MSPPEISILIPTRGRPDYLDVTLASVAPQARAAGAEVIVVDDAGDGETQRVATRHGVGHRSTPAPHSGANAARNVGIQAAHGDVIVLIDDDIRAPSDWLAQLRAGIAATPGADVFGGPIRADLEGGGPHSCGRERPPITTLDLGPCDRDAALVWSANMAIRRTALERVGDFDESIRGRGEEEDWERRYAGDGARIRYLAAAGIEHRRTRADARLRPLSAAAYALGRSARRHDERKGQAPAPSAEAWLVVRCLVHAARFRCPLGLVAAAQAAGRLRESVSR